MADAQEELRRDEAWMKLALAQARLAGEAGEVPVGVVIVHGERAIARAHNQRETLVDPTAHAEMIALTQAASSLETWRLDGATAYVTLEPCPMCAGAFVLARIGRVVFGANDPKGGACGTLYSLHDDPRLNHRFPAVGGVLAAECGEVLTRFFRARRGAKRMNENRANDV